MNTVQRVNEAVMKLALPEGVEHYYMHRKTRSLVEGFGRYGVDGEKNMSALAFNNAIASANGAGLVARLHTTGLSGWSTDPMGTYGGSFPYTLVSKVPISDILVHPNLHKLLGDETEAVILNNPDRAAIVIPNRGKHKDPSKDFYSQPWISEDSNTGLIPKHGFPPETWGIHNPNEDFSETHKPVTQGEFEGISPGKLGTNAGGVYKDSNNNVFYMKYGNEEQAVVEHLVNTFYQKAGIPVAKTQLVNWKGRKAVRSAWLHGSKYQYEGSPPESLANHKDVKEGMLVDMLLSNWDVAGAGSERPYGNIIEHEGKMVRIDNGGSLWMKGLPTPDSSHKPHNGFWESNVKELESFQNHDINPTTAHLFKDMDTKSRQGAFDSLLKLNNTTITELVNDSAYGIAGNAVDKGQRDALINQIIARRAKIVEWAIAQKITDKEYNNVDEANEALGLLKAEVLLKEEESKLEPIYHFSINGDEADDETDDNP